jgi:hypothetical protein
MNDQEDSKQKNYDSDRDSNSKLNFIIIVVSVIIIWICFLIWIIGMSKDHDNDKQSENETTTVRVFKANDYTISGAQFNSVPLGATEQQVKEQFGKPYGWIGDSQRQCIGYQQEELFGQDSDNAIKGENPLFIFCFWDGLLDLKRQSPGLEFKERDARPYPIP